MKFKSILGILLMKLNPMSSTPLLYHLINPYPTKLPKPNQPNYPKNQTYPNQTTQNQPYPNPTQPNYPNQNYPTKTTQPKLHKPNPTKTTQTQPNYLNPTFSGWFDETKFRNLPQYSIQVKCPILEQFTRIYHTMREACERLSTTPKR